MPFIDDDPAPTATGTINFKPFILPDLPVPPPGIQFTSHGFQPTIISKEAPCPTKSSSAKKPVSR